MFRNSFISHRRSLSVVCCSDCVRAIGSSVKRKVHVSCSFCRICPHTHSFAPASRPKTPCRDGSMQVIVYVPSCSARDGSTTDTSSCEFRAAHSPNHSQDSGTLGASAEDSSSTKDIPSTQIGQEDNSLAVRCASRISFYLPCVANHLM